MVSDTRVLGSREGAQLSREGVCVCPSQEGREAASQPACEARLEAAQAEGQVCAWILLWSSSPPAPGTPPPRRAISPAIGRRDREPQSHGAKLQWAVRLVTR